MSDEIKLRCDSPIGYDYTPPIGYDYTPRYDSEGRIKIFADKKPCPLKANSTEDVDAWVQSMLPNDSELISLLGGDPNAPQKANPFKEARDLVLVEALVGDLAAQVHRLATGADEAERKELEAMGMPSDEELLKNIRGR